MVSSGWNDVAYIVAADKHIRENLCILSFLSCSLVWRSLRFFHAFVECHIFHHYIQVAIHADEGARVDLAIVQLYEDTLALDLAEEISRPCTTRSARGT